MRPRYHPASFHLLLAALIVIISSTLIPAPRPLFAAPAPSISITGNSFAPLGQQVAFTLTFQNTGTQTGFGPFVDLVFPASGADGDDGLRFVNATYLGTALETRTLTFPPSGCVQHPLARLVSGDYQEVCGTPGDTLVVLRLPFGSFTPEQPAINISVVGQIDNRADLDYPLTVRTRTGFQFGATPLNDWCCDTLLLSDGQGQASTASSTWAQSVTVIPTLISLAKSYNGPESETATGPNFPRSYTLSADVATGQLVRNLVITDTLPNNLAFLNLASSSPTHTSLVTPPVGVPNNPPTNQLAVGYPNILGGTGTSDASASLSFFASRLDANGNPVLNPSTGLAVVTENNLHASYSWTPIDPRDAIVTATIDLPGPEHTLTLRSLAVQKSVALQTDTGAPGYTPGDTVQYTLQLQVSDFFAFDQVLLTDVMSDGLRLDPTFVPTLQVNGNGYSLPNSPFAAANYTVDLSQIGNDTNPVTNGSTRFLFRVSDELVTRGRQARLVGGCINPTTGSNPPNCSLYNDGPTTATIIFRALIQDEFSDTYPSGDQSVDEGDVLGNRVTASGRVLNVTTASFSPTANTVSDTSAASLNIQRGTIAKTIYALNGSTTLPNPFEVTAGDVVTYRLRTTLPSSDIEQLRLVDYLPLPIFSASTVTSFDQSFPGTGVPPAGTVAYGPTHSLNSLAPTLHPTMTISVAGNSVEFNYGSFDDPLNRPSTIDLLLSVTVRDQPTADGLFITNQLRRFSGATNTPDAADDAIVQIKITQPVLRVSKGVIGTSNPGAIYTAPIGPTGFTGPGSPLTSNGLATTPVDADVSGVDANDRVSFAIVLENVGSGTRGAYDIAIRDLLPPGLVIPPGGINLQAYTGAGVPRSLTFLGPSGTASDLFTNGVQLVDDTDLGACQKFDPTSGANIIVLTYDLLVDPNITPGTPVLNRGTLTSYAATEGGTNHVGAGSEPFDRASVTARMPTLSKAILATSEAHTNDATADTIGSPRPLAIGEVVTFTLAYSIPEGLSSSLLITDTLPSGMIYVANSARVAFVSSATSTLTSTTLVGAGLNLVGSNPNVVATFALPPAAVSGGLTSGAPVRFSLGDLRNSDNDDNDEFVVVQFGAVLDNTLNAGLPRNIAGTNLSNSALASTSSLSAPINSGSVHLRVLEPSLTISKLLTEPIPALADAGDVVTYTVTIANASGPNVTTAFDLLLDDTLPVSVTLNAGSLATSGSAGASGLVPSVDGATARLNLSALEPGATATLTYSVTLRDVVTPGELITNTARVRYTSLPGANGTANATPGASGSENGERSGFVAGNQNSRYLHTATASLIVFEPAPFKQVIATSEAHTVGSDVTIGEVVTFRLSVRKAEGTSPNLQLRDALPRGLNYIADTARVALVSTNPALFTSSTLSGAGLHIAGNDPNVTPSFVLPASAVSLSGDIVTFSLGTLINSENDADSEYVVLTFQAVVDNEGNANATDSNDAGENLVNTFTMLVNGVASAPSNPVSLRILEPQLTMTKARTAVTNFDAGNVFTYTLTITNANLVTSTLAFDSVITESLHANLLLNASSITLTVGGVPTSFSTISTGANGFTLGLPNLNPGQVARLSFQVVGGDLITPGQSLTSTTTLRYTSLPGPNGTANATPGAPGSGTGERIGSGGVNDYVRPLNDSFTSRNLTRAKFLNTTSEASTSAAYLTIGEVARFRLSVLIPEGVTPNLRVVDSLPNELSYIAGTGRVALVRNTGMTSSVLPACANLELSGDTGNATNPANTAVTCPIEPTVQIGTSVTTYTFSLGNLTNNDRDSDLEYVIIDFEALVSNVSANQAGLNRDNQLRTQIGTGSLSAPVTTSITLAEPQLTLSHVRTSGSPVDAGDLVTYTLTLTNSGLLTSTTAFDLNLGDLLPPGLELIPASVSASGGVGWVNSSTPTELRGSFTSLISNTVATVTYSARVRDLALAGGTITTTATVTYTSLPGTAGTTPTGITTGTRGTPGAANGERIGSAGDSLNDYLISANATVDILTPTISKALASGANATPTIGELVTYTLSITLPEGTTNGLVVTDALPLGMAYLAGSVSVSSPNYVVGTPSLTATGGGGDPV
ncbi:MAG: beta strand repeat-containing protein, partial [Oscillochloridaceae bacterium umkhey_bin13]